jgi:glyoxylase-like metal-dependent hydrolase (beta-lactamase superfamily II)
MSGPRRLGEVAPGVFVATSSRCTTTTTVITDGDRALLVDPCWTPTELDELAGELSALGLRVATGFSTHAHHDHMLWHPDFGDGPRWTSPAAFDFAHRYHDELVEALGDDWPEELADVFDGLAALDDETVPAAFGDNGSAEPIRLLTHDGHSPGHTALWLEDRGVFVAGDMLSDLELPLPFSPDDLPGYLQALDLLAPYVLAAGTLIPGHGHVTDNPIERLDADRRYLDEVIAGRDAPDPRRANRDMEESHQRIVHLAREMS